MPEPWLVLGPILVVQWIALAIFTQSVHRNGWLFYQGGDQIWYWTTGWLLGHGWIPQTTVAHGWSLIELPFVYLAGRGFVAGLPWVLLLQVLVLTPIALWCVYELGARIGGRLIGYLAAALWTLGPYLAIPLFVHRYHEKYVDQYLPHPLGLTAMADYPAIVVLLVSAVFTLRALQLRDLRSAAIAGLACGFAAVMKPSNLLFLAAAPLGLLAARRWRELGIFAVAVVPALGALTLWKYRGIGFVPAFGTAFSPEQTRVALGTDTLRFTYDRYVNIDWHNLRLNQLGLAEVFWSLRLLEWLPVAGAIAVARRSIPVAVLLSAWFWVFLLFKGSATSSSIDSGSFFRFVLPAIPALVLFAAALPLLVPRYGTVLADRFPAPRPRSIPVWALVAAAVVLGFLPLASVAGLRQVRGPVLTVNLNGIEVPVDGGLRLSVTRHAGALELSWRERNAPGSKVFYKVLRSRGAKDYSCDHNPNGPDRCLLASKVVLATKGTRATDHPARDTWTYRVGVGANWRDDPTLGDVFLVSDPVTVRVR